MVKDFDDVTGVVKIFADVTAITFDDVTTIVPEIFFDDVTANHIFQCNRETMATAENILPPALEIPR